MPIYEYRCQVCGARFEKFVRASADATQLVCPDCGSPQVEKAFSVFATAGLPTRQAEASAPVCGPVS